SGYQSQLHLAGLPAAAAGAVRSSVFAGIAVARRLGSPALLESVRAAFVHGITLMLWVSAGLAVVAVVLALLFLAWPGPAGPGAAGRRRPPPGCERIGACPRCLNIRPRPRPPGPAGHGRGCASARRPGRVRPSGSTRSGCSARRATTPPPSSRSPT